MNGPMAAVAVLATVAGVLVFTMRNHVKSGAGGRGDRTAACERAAAVIFAVAVFCGLIAFAPGLAVLWQVTGTGPGLVVLLAVLAITGVFAFLGVFRGGKAHHHHGTIAVSVTFAAALALLIGGWHQITRSTGQGLASARHQAGGVINGTAFTAPAAGRHHPAAAAHAAGGHLTVIVAAVLLAALVIVWANGYRKSGKAAAPRRAHPGTQAGGGQPGPARLTPPPRSVKEAS